MQHLTDIEDRHSTVNKYILHKLSTGIYYIRLILKIKGQGHDISTANISEMVTVSFQMTYLHLTLAHSKSQLDQLDQLDELDQLDQLDQLDHAYSTADITIAKIRSTISAYECYIYI